jgi:hypothetical protein
MQASGHIMNVNTPALELEGEEEKAKDEVA